MHHFIPGHGAGRRVVTLLGAVAALIAGLVAATALAQPAGKQPASSAAASSGQPVQTTAAAQQAPRNLNRKCGRSKSRKRIRSRRTYRLASGTIRTRSIYCDGSQRVRDRRQTVRNVPVDRPVPGPTQTVTGPTQTIPGPTETITGPTETVTGPTETVTGPTETVTTTVPVEVPEPPKAYRLTLLHNNDGESKLLSGDSVTNTPHGGAARYKTRIDQLRAEAAAYTDPDIQSGAKRKGTINVSSGDNFLAGLNYQGSVVAGRFYDSFAVSRIGYDAITMGNHEFDFGPNRLADFIEDDASETTFISANLDFSAEPRMDALADSGRIQRSVVIERGGDRIGVIGLTTPTISFISSPGNTIINGTTDQELADIVNAEVTDLEAQGVNKIILSSHLQGIASEKALIPRLSGVDVVIAGGGDELLINEGQPMVTPLPPGAPTPPRYPDQTAQDADGRTVPVVTTQGEYRYVGRLMAEFDGAGHITSIDPGSGPVRVWGTPGDPDAVARNPQLVKEIDEPLLAFRAVVDANVIATTEVHLDGRNSASETIRRRETNLGNLVADAFWYVGRRDAVAHGDPLPDVAITNGGGIRNTNVFPACPAFPGSVSEGDTFRVLPFENTIVKVGGITPARLKELLEAGYRILPTGGGSFAQIAGMKVVVDPAGTAQVTNTATGVVTSPGTKVRRIQLMDPNGTLGDVIVDDGAVVPAQATRQLVVMTTDFLARNGDGYPFGGTTFDPMDPPVLYQKALFRYLTEPTGDGGLGGTGSSPTITSAKYPLGTVDRITIQPNAGYPTTYPPYQPPGPPTC